MFITLNYLGTPHSMGVPGVSQWQPVSVNVANTSSSIIPANNQFFALHGDTHNLDELRIAAATELALDWTAEPAMFIAEGATEDVDCYLYFSPIGPQENLILILLYAYDLLNTGNGRYQLVTAGRQDFTGGTGASPALSADGARVYTADNDHNVLAFDRDLNLLWSIKLPENIPASISVSSENNELYAVSLENIYKLRDLGDHAEWVWTSQLDAFPEIGPYRNFNMTTATIVANGIAVSVGAGLTNGAFTLPLKVGTGLLDRETGKLIAYNAAREESVSVTAVSGNGGYYLANSPIRRAVASTLFGPFVRPLTGGISRYKPTNPAELASAATAASHKRLQAAESSYDPLQEAQFRAHAQTLAAQSRDSNSSANKCAHSDHLVEAL